MSQVAAIAAFIFSIVVALFWLVLNEEYQFWAPKVATRIVGLAALLIPRPQRVARREEWLGEAQQLRGEGHGGILFSIGLVIAAAHIRATWLTERAPTLRALIRRPRRQRSSPPGEHSAPPTPLATVGHETAPEQESATPAPARPIVVSHVAVQTAARMARRGR